MTLFHTPLLLSVMLTWAGLSAAAELDLADDLPGKDRPPVGRSVFDHLVVSDDGTKMDVPFPINALLAQIEGKTGVKPKAVMIPKGRSLQRDKTSFEAPRIVFAFDSASKQSDADLGIMIKDRLYLGYAEHSEQIEVISYNAAAGRYEFQLVHDYKDGGKRELAYANRALCVKCHHNGAPIFNPNPWPETNGSTSTDHKIADLISGARNEATTYHTYPIKQSREISYDIDNSTDRANFVMPYQKLWTTGCGGSGAEANACRANILRFALELAFTSPSTFSQDSANYTALKATWDKAWLAMGGGMKIPNPNILPYDPLEETGTNDGFVDLGPGLSDEEADRVRGILETSDVPKDKDPLFQFLGALEVWSLDSICHGKCVIYGVNRFLTDADKQQLRQVTSNNFGKVSAAIDSLLASSDASLSNRPFRRGVVMRALLTKLIGQDVASGGDADSPLMPAPKMDVEEESTPSDDTPIAYMKFYCAPCHFVLPGKKGFLAGTAEETMAKIKEEAAVIIARLDWTAPAVEGHGTMPPKTDEKRAKLAAKPEHHQAIVDWVKSL